MTAFRTLLLLTLWSAGCAEDPDYNPLFDGPGALSVLYPAAESGWDQPIGFVANKRSGQIIPLDRNMRRARSVVAPLYALEEQLEPNACSARSTPMNQVRAHFINAIDHRFDALLCAFHQHHRDSILGRRWSLTHSPVSFEDADSSGDAPEITGLQLRAGATTTEQWTLTFNGTSWQVDGSRSGLMENLATPEQPYVSDSEELAFTITGSATYGDQFQFNTYTLLRELKLDGHPLRMMGLSNKWLLVSVPHKKSHTSP